MLKTKNYDILDLTKLILSIMIVAIHTSLLPTVLYPWLRLAVPLFFIISSFFLFNKVNNSTQDESGKIVKNFLLRYAKLYLFWFIVLLPLTIYYRKNWFTTGIWNAIYTIIKNILFSSTFVASWFISATIAATFIIYKVSKKINYKILFFVFMIIYFLCCIVSSYLPLFTDMPLVNKIYDIYVMFFGSPVFSFPAALIWVFIGKMFADKIIKHEIANKKLHLLFIFIFCVLLFIEWKYAFFITGKDNNDYYFFLLPVAILIFQFLLNIKITLKNGKLFRKVSIITYPLHASIAPIFFRILKFFTDDDIVIGIVNFIVTLMFCYVICWIIFKLEDNEHFKILRYSH